MMNDVALSTPDVKEDRHFVTAVARALEILTAFDGTDGALTNGELSLRCQLPKSTVSRLTYTLTKIGYLEQNLDGKYRLGFSTLALGGSILVKLDIRRIARPLMQKLADETGCVVALGIRHKNSILYIETCRSTSEFMTLRLDTGSNIPVMDGAIGRAWLASITGFEKKKFISEYVESNGISEYQLIDKLEKNAADYKENSIASSFGEWNKEVNGIARGIRMKNGSPTMAINCGGPAYKFSKEYLLTHVKHRLIELSDYLESKSD